MEIKALIVKIHNAVGVFLLSTLVFTILVQVIMRYVFHSSLSWTTEIVCYNLAILTFYGSTLAMRDDQHLSVSILTDSLNKRTSHIIYIFGYLAIEFFLIILFVSSIILIKTNGSKLTIATEFPLWIFYINICISVFLMIFLNVANFVKYLNNHNKGN